MATTNIGIYVLERILAFSVPASPGDMTDARTSSSNTLLEGMEQVRRPAAELPTSRKRELEDKIRVACQHFCMCSMMCGKGTMCALIGTSLKTRAALPK